MVNLGKLKQIYLSRAGSNEDEYHLAKNHLLKSTAILMNQCNPAGILVEQGDYLILIPDCEKTTQLAMIRKDLQSLAESICDLVKDTLGECSVLIAFGGFYESIQGLRNSYEEAKSTLRVCQNQIFQQQIIWYDDVALYVLLDRIAAQPDTLQWFVRTIGRPA